MIHDPQLIAAAAANRANEQQARELRGDIRAAGAGAIAGLAAGAVATLIHFWPGIEAAFAAGGAG